MPRPRPPHLQRRKTRHGKYIWVVQISRGAPIVRIREEYGTPEFEQAYHDALASAATPVRKIHAASGTIKWGWLRYKQSADWKALASSTQDQRDNIMSHVIEASGDKPISALNRASIQAGIDSRGNTPFQAKNFLQTMSQFCKWLVQDKKLSSDPTAGLKVKKPKTRGFLEWTYEEVQRYEQRWPRGTRERVMLDVYMYTGLRRGDAARVGPGHVYENTISLATEKSQGQTVVHLPLLAALQETLAAGPTGKLSFICKQDGMPYVKESLGNAFKEACVAAGVLDKSAHGLRKAAATRAAENGATANELMAIFGWIDIKEAELYTRRADRKRLAMQAMNKLEA